MQNRKLSVLFVFVFAALALSGWSCGNGYGVNNNEPETSGGPQTYQNSEWGVSFQYPEGWQYREYRETIEGAEIVTLAFSDTSLPETLPPEPVFPIMVSRDVRTISEAAVAHADAISISDTTLGGRSAKIVTRYSEILEQNYSIYLIALGSGSIKFLPMDTRYVSVAESMINTLTERE